MPGESDTLLAHNPTAAPMLLLALSLIALPQSPLPIPGAQGGGVPVPGGPNPGAALTGTAPQQPPPTPLTVEQKAERLSSRLTTLATRVQTLRRMSGTENAKPPEAEPPKPEIEAIRTEVSNIAIEIQRRAMGIETTVAGETTKRLFRARGIDSTAGFKPSPELRRDLAVSSSAQPTASQPAGPTLPAFDLEKAANQIAAVHGEPVFRGDLEKMVAARRRYMKDARDESLAQFVLNQALLPRAAVLKSTGPQIPALFKRANDLRSQVISGQKTFEDLASNVSDDPSTKAFGGRFEANPMILNDFERATIQEMKPGDISGPIATIQGVEILKLEAMQENPNDPTSAKVTIRRILLGYNFGVPFEQAQGQIQALIRGMQVEVLDPAYEPFVPPQLPRKPKGVPASAPASAPADGAKK